MQDGQSLMDFAVQHRGAWEASIDIALASGVSITATPEAGKPYRLPEQVYSRVMMAHCLAYSVSPATLHDTTDIRWRIFAKAFTSEYK